MKESLDLSSLIPDQTRDEIKDILLDIYGQTEIYTTTEYDDNYTFYANLYRRSFNALNSYARKSKLVENLSCNGRAILQPINSSLYLRFLNCSPSEHRRKKGGNDIYDIFGILDKPPFSYSLFNKSEQIENKLFGFFFIETNSDDIPYVRLQVLDECWRLVTEWSSDNVQNEILLTSDSFEEESKELPKAVLLENGDSLLRPSSSNDSSRKNSINE